MRVLLLILVAVSLLAILEFFKAPQKSLLWYWGLDAGHWPLFGVFALAVLGIVRELAHGPRISRLGQYGLAFVVTAAFCLLTEILQYFGPRDADLQDLFRGLSGALALLLLRLAFDREGLQGIAGGPRLLRFVLVLAVIGLFWWSCGPLINLVAAYSKRGEAFPQLCTFQESWEGPFRGTVEAELAIVTPPEGWPGESEENLVGQITFRPPATFPGFSLDEVHPDWSEYDRLCFEIFTELDAPVELILRLNDRAHDKTFNDRFHRSLIIHPGMNQICLELEDVRNAPKGREMDMSQMYTLALFAVRPEEEFSVYVDSFRLEKN